MKALFISNDPTIFDAGSPARARMHAYADALGELHIVSSGAPGTRDVQDGNLYLYPTHAWDVFRVQALADRARKVILAHAIDVVSAQDPFEHGLAALKSVEQTNVRLHIQVHTDFLSPWFVRGRMRNRIINRYRRHVAEQVLPRADGIRTVSERVKRSMVHKYGKHIVEPTVVPITVQADIPTPAPLPEHPFPFALMCVGRLESEKRVGDILKALALFIEEHPRTGKDVGLFVVGDGRERAKLEAQARDLGLGKQVQFLGWRTDALALMGSAQVFVQASAFEGYSRTLIEAALARVPIVTTDVGVVGDVFERGVDVLSAPVARPAALATRIATLVEDGERRKELITNAAAAAQAHLAQEGDLISRIVEDLSKVIVRT